MNAYIKRGARIRAVASGKGVRNLVVLRDTFEGVTSQLAAIGITEISKRMYRYEKIG